MGNCCGNPTSGATSLGVQRRLAEKEELLLRSGGGRGGSGCGGGGDKVRIRISKRQLEELLKRVEVIDLDDHENGSMNKNSKKKKKKIREEETLQRLIDESDHLEIHHHHQGPWRPSLESIPEVD